MTNIEDDIATAEAEWVPTVAIKEEPPEMGLALKAGRVFEAQILPLEVVRKRRAELGVENAALCTRDQRQALVTISGMWKKINGQVDKVGKFLKNDALKVQRTVNDLMKKVKGEVLKEHQPILNKLAEWKAEDEAAEQAVIQAQRDAEDAERKAAYAAEAEANRLEAERLAKASKKLACDVAEFAVWCKQKADAEETARQTELAKAEAFQAQQAAERERLRLEALEPDIPKVRRLAASVNNLLAASFPSVESDDAKATVMRAITDLQNIVTYLLNFGTK